MTIKIKGTGMKEISTDPRRQELEDRIKESQADYDKLCNLYNKMIMIPALPLTKEPLHMIVDMKAIKYNEINERTIALWDYVQAQLKGGGQ